MIPGYVYECIFTAGDASLRFSKKATVCKADGDGGYEFIGFKKGMVSDAEADPFEVHWLDKGRITMRQYSFDPCGEADFLKRCVKELILRDDEVKAYRRRIWGQLRRK